MVTPVSADYPMNHCFPLQVLGYAWFWPKAISSCKRGSSLTWNHCWPRGWSFHRLPTTTLLLCGISGDVQLDGRSSPMFGWSDPYALSLDHIQIPDLLDVAGTSWRLKTWSVDPWHHTMSRYNWLNPVPRPTSHGHGSHFPLCNHALNGLKSSAHSDIAWQKERGRNLWRIIWLSRKLIIYDG